MHLYRVDGFFGQEGIGRVREKQIPIKADNPVAALHMYQKISGVKKDHHRLPDFITLSKEEELIYSLSLEK